MNDVILNIDNIYKSFDDNHIHRGISIKLHKGESLGLLGGSGTGKSVLLRSLIGLDRIDQGQIIFQNKRIDDLTEDDLLSIRLQLSYSFQNGALFDSLSVFENISFPLFHHTNDTFEEVQKKVCNMLDLIGLSGKADLMPSDLSGGMKKRVGMARSMILNPEVILYDEPTAGLDPANTQNIIRLMKQFKKQGQTCIFVTHDIPAALQLCDRLIVLEAGHIIFDGTTKSFEMSQDPIIKSFRKHEGERDDS